MSAQTISAKYALFPEKDVVSIETESMDSANISPDSLLIEAETSVISAGTELANLTALDSSVYTPGAWNAYPWRPGYGLVGRVLKVGERVDRFAEGDRVFCFGKHASHQVYEMLPGVVTRAAFPVDDDLPAEQLAVLRMALVALTAPQVADFDVGDTVVIFGLGLVGNLAAQLFQLGGARVLAFDLVPERCEVARQAGITSAYEVPAEKQVETMLELTGGRGAHITVDAVGDSSVIQTCAETTHPFGQIILLGTPRAPLQSNITPLLDRVHRNWLSIRGALEWRIPAYPTTGSRFSSQLNLATLIDYLKADRLKIAPLISHVIQPDTLPDAYQGLLHDKAHYWGVVIDWRS